MKNKIFSGFKAFRDALANVLDNFAPFAQVHLEILFLALIGIGIGALINISLIKEANISKLEHVKQIFVEGQAFSLFLPLIKKNIISLLLTLTIFGFIFCWVWLGYTKFMLEMHDNKKSSSSTLFSISIFQVFKYLVAGFLYILLVLVGLIFFIVPGIYYFIRFGFFRYYIVDKNAGIKESLSLSWHVTENNGWNLFAFDSIYYFLSMLIPFVTWPILGFAGACAYRQLDGSELD